jgi:DNA-binding IclR family transcriptional regulator
MLFGRSGDYGRAGSSLLTAGLGRRHPHRITPSKESMMTQRLSIALTILNLILLALVLAERHAVSAQDDAPLLRGRGLEIVDERGRVRASISVHGPTTVCFRPAAATSR